MVWVGFFWGDQTETCFINERINTEPYMNIFEEHLLPYAHACNGTKGDDLMLMLDGATLQRANETLNWFQQVGVTVMDWPSVSPNLIPKKIKWENLTQ